MNVSAATALIVALAGVAVGVVSLVIAWWGFVKVRRVRDAQRLMKEAEELADRIGLLDRGELLFLEPVQEVKERYAVETLEEAFFAATGRTYEDEQTEEDEEREVFA